MADNSEEIQQGSTQDSEINRAQQVSKEGSDYEKQSVNIVDVDTAILSYLEDVGIHVESNGERIPVPVIYGSPEKWKRASDKGFIRDEKGQVQLPLIMFKRNNLSPDDNIDRKFNKGERISYTTGYSKKNKFDKFSKQVGLKPTQEIYKVRVGDHVQMDYEFIMWTEYVSHTNQLIEQLNWNSNEYWGVSDGKKFKSSIDSFSTSIDVADGSDRIVRTNFTLNVKGYLLPDSVEDSEMDEQVKKGYTTQKTVMISEVETGLDDITSMEELDEAIRKNS